MQLFDTHAHYNLDPVWSNWQQAVIDAKSAGITGAMVVGTDPETCERALVLKRERGDFFRASLGLHPEIVEEAWDEKNLAQAVEFFDSRLREKDFDAYGEIGLDFFHLDRQNDSFSKIMRFQSDLFKTQLLGALECPKTVILHARDKSFAPESAYHLILDLIDELGAQELTYIFHCFSGTREYLARVLRLPHAWVSFAGNLTFKNAPDLRALCQAVPSERLLLETDCPFLSPVPKRGQPCQPAFLRLTAEFAARELGVDLAQIYQNSISVFS